MQPKLPPPNSTLTTDSVLEASMCLLLSLGHEYYPESNDLLREWFSALLLTVCVFTVWVYTCPGYVCSTEQTRALVWCLYKDEWVILEPSAVLSALCSLEVTELLLIAVRMGSMCWWSYTHFSHNPILDKNGIATVNSLVACLRITMIYVGESKVLFS